MLINGGMRLKITDANTPYNVLADDYTVRIDDATAGGGVVTLPVITAQNHGQVYQVKNFDASNIATVTPSGGDTIDGNANLPLNPFDNGTVQADNTSSDWMIL